MSRVKAISGATGQDFEDLKNIAAKMGAETKYTAVEARVFNTSQWRASA